MGRALRCVLATALLHLAGRPRRIVRPAKHFGLQEGRGKSAAVGNDTHRSLVGKYENSSSERKSRVNKRPIGLESEPISNPKTFPAPESELLDRLAPDWQLRLHDGAVIDHILEVINKPRKPYRSHASLSNSSRWLRPGVRQKTALTLPGSLYFSGPREFSSDQVKRLA